MNSGWISSGSLFDAGERGAGPLLIKLHDIQ